MNKFVILSQPRTGSTLITSLIASHKGVRCLVEPINPSTHNHHMKPIPGSPGLIPEVLIQNKLEPTLNKLLSKGPLPQNWNSTSKTAEIAAGFKIMAHQVRGLKHSELFWEYLHKNSIKVLLVFRENIAMQYISDLIVKKTRQCAVWSGEPKTAQVEVPIKSLRENLRRIKEERRYLLERSRNLDRRRLTYEKFKDNITTVESILPWLTGAKYNVTSKLQKQNPDSMRSRVTNYDQLVAELRRLKFDHLISE